MKIYSEIPRDLPPTALTLGTFDGVHLGHQSLLKRLREVGKHTTVITFSNHPLSILQPTVPPPMILTPIETKLSLLKSCQVDAVIVLSFTNELKDLSYETFLAPIPLTHLILGENDAFGKNRAGNQENITSLAKKRGFCVEYIQKTILDGEPISSRRIRNALKEHNLELAARLLGRSLTPGSHHV